jgi:hypothetical protein
MLSKHHFNFVNLKETCDWLGEISSIMKLHLIFLIFLFYSVTAINDITLDKLKTATLLSYSSYCENLTNWSCYWCKQTNPITVTSLIYDKKTDTFGYVGHTSTHSKFHHSPINLPQLSLHSEEVFHLKISLQI